MSDLQDTIELLEEAEELLEEKDPLSREARAAEMIREARIRAERSRGAALRELGIEDYDERSE